MPDARVADGQHSPAHATSSVAATPHVERRPSRAEASRRSRVVLFESLMEWSSFGTGRPGTVIASITAAKSRGECLAPFPRSLTDRPKQRAESGCHPWRSFGMSRGTSGTVSNRDATSRAVSQPSNRAA